MITNIDIIFQFYKWDIITGNPNGNIRIWDTVHVYNGGIFADDFRHGVCLPSSLPRA